MNDILRLQPFFVHSGAGRILIIKIIQNELTIVITLHITSLLTGSADTSEQFFMKNCQ